MPFASTFTGVSSQSSSSVRRHQLHAVALSFALAVASLSACSGDDEGVSGKQKADANGLLADGAIRGLDGSVIGDAGDGAGDDGSSGGFDIAAGDGSGTGDGSGDAGAADVSTTDSAGLDAGSGDAGSGDAGASGKTPCTNNTVCKNTEFCALYYNNVQQLEGDGSPVKLPGWANLCEPDGVNKAQEGEACDPIAGDGDTSLKVCVNASTCMQGTCTALCETDSQCPTGTRCGLSEYGKQLPKAGGGSGTAWLPIDLCVPLPSDAGVCVKDADCNAGAVCRPWVKHLGDDNTSEGRCVTPEAGKQKTGGACGVKSTASGLGKLCESSLCLYEYGGTQTGVCTSTCDSHKDCPTTLSWNGTAFPTACVGLLANHSGTEAADDDVYIPHCVAVNEKSSLTDCEASRTCAGTSACRAYAIARGPDTAAKVDYLCIELTTKTQPKGPTLDDGAACDPFAVDSACKGGYCLIGANGKGYCSRLCKDATGCGGGTKCDTNYALIPRKDATKAATTGICLN